MTEKRLCRDFIKNPKVDPIDGHRLTPGKKSCLVKKFLI